MDELRYSVPGISCAHCSHAISGEVKKVEGVSTVDVDLPTRTVVVRGSAVDDSSVRAAIVDAGYEVTRLSS
jgi:copper chaperone